MCTFTPYLFPNCHCGKIDTGALELCSAATRTGEQCPKPKRELLQKRPGTCGPCEQVQVAKATAKAAAENAKIRAGRDDSVVDATNDMMEVVAAEGAKDAEVTGAAPKSSAKGKGKASGKASGKVSGSGQGVGGSRRQTRSGSKVTTLPTR